MVILKDRADALLALSIFIVPYKIISLFEGIPFYETFRNTLLFTLLFLNLINAISYNQKNIPKSLVSMFFRVIFSYFLAEALIKILTIHSNIYSKLALILGVLIFYLFIVRFLRWGEEKLTGKYRITFSYAIGEAVFFYGSIIFSIYLIFKGYGFWLALKVFAFGYIAKIIFRILASASIKSHIRELIKKFGEKWWRYRITVFHSKEPNAFAYWKGSKNAIGITTALAKKFTADEINFTVAHEYAHHIKNHLTVKYTTEMIHRGGFLIFEALNMLTPFTIAIGGIFHLLKKALYKSEEYEADRVAVHLLQKAGLTQKGAITLFEKFLKLEPKQNWFVRKIANLFLEDHPYSEKRLEKLKKFIQF